MRRILLALSALALTSCTSDAPSAPDAPRYQAPESALMRRGDDTYHVDGVRRLKPIGHEISVSAVIGPKGGALSIDAAGFTLTVPAGAVREPTRFTVTALAGRLAAYHFEPHGVAFPVPLGFAQDMRDLEFDPAVDLPQGAYFKEDRDLDQKSGAATVHELIDASYDRRTGRTTFPLQHFSGYIVAAGRF